MQPPLRLPLLGGGKPQGQKAEKGWNSKLTTHTFRGVCHDAGLYLCPFKEKFKINLNFKFFPLPWLTLQVTCFQGLSGLLGVCTYISHIQVYIAHTNSQVAVT